MHKKEVEGMLALSTKEYGDDCKGGFDAGNFAFFYGLVRHIMFSCLADCLVSNHSQLKIPIHVKLSE